MRIVHVVRGMSNSSGTTQIVRALASHQAEQGHEVRILTVERRSENASLPSGARLQAEVLPATWLGLQRWRMLKNLGYSIPFRKRLERVISECDFVHIHAIWNYPTFCAMRVADRAGVPYAVSPQGSLEEWALGQSQYVKAIYGRLWEKPLYDRAAGMLVLTEAEAIQCQRYGIRSPFERLPNGVDLRPIASESHRVALRVKWNAPAHDPLFLFLSRLHVKKGIDLLIQAISQLDPQMPFQLWVVGHDAHGDFDARLRQMVQERNLQRKIRLLGEVQGDAKFELLQLADVFVLPSHSEGMPMAVLEALSCGIPVLITPGCNLPEVETARAGWITNPEVGKLHSAIEMLIASRQEWAIRGQAGHELVKEHYSWPILAAKSVMLYEKMAKNRLAREGGIGR